MTATVTTPLPFGNHQGQGLIFNQIASVVIRHNGNLRFSVLVVNRSFRFHDNRFIGIPHVHDLAVDAAERIFWSG